MCERSFEEASITKVKDYYFFGNHRDMIKEKKKIYIYIYIYIAFSNWKKKNTPLGED